MIKKIVNAVFPLHKRLFLAQKGVESALDMFKFAHTKLTQANETLRKLMSECDAECQKHDEIVQKAIQTAEARKSHAMSVRTTAQSKVEHNERVAQRLNDLIS